MSDVPTTIEVHDLVKRAESGDKGAVAEIKKIIGSDTLGFWDVWGDLARCAHDR